MALIWTLSSFSLRDVPVPSVPFRDKGLHFVAYAVLGFWVAHAVRATWAPNGPCGSPHETIRALTRTVTVAWLITSAWGGLDELHQAFVPGRTYDILDFLADAVGAIVGVKIRVAGALWRWCKECLFFLRSSFKKRSPP